MDVRVLAVIAVTRRSVRGNGIGNRKWLLAMRWAVVVMVIVLATRRMGQDDLAHPVACSIFMRVRRRCRHGAKLRHRNNQQPAEETMQANHAPNLLRSFLPVLEGSSLALWGLARSRKAVRALSAGRPLRHLSQRGRDLRLAPEDDCEARVTARAPVGL